MLDAFKQFFTNETVREQAWEATKAGVSYGVDTASEYMPGTKALLTAAAVVVGGVALVGGGRELHRRGHLARVTPDANTFTRERWLKRTAPHQSTTGSVTASVDSSSSKPDTSNLASTSSDLGQDKGDEVARHTRSHDREEGDKRSRSSSPKPGKSSGSSDD